jgi:hypothetical protein
MIYNFKHNVTFNFRHCLASHQQENHEEHYIKQLKNT